MSQRPGKKPEAERETLNDIPPEQSTGLVPKAVHPLETQALQDSWCARLLPGEEAERYPHAHEPGLGQLVAEPADQLFLLRKAKTNQDQRRPCAPKRLLDPVQLLRIVLVSKWGAVGFHALKTRIPSPEPPRGGRGHAGVPTEEKHETPAWAAASGRLRTRSLPGTLSGTGVPATREAQTTGSPSATLWLAARTSLRLSEFSVNWRRMSRFAVLIHPPFRARRPSRTILISVCWSSWSKGRPMIQAVSGAEGIGRVVGG